MAFDQTGDQPTRLGLRHELLQKRGGGAVSRFRSDRLLHRGKAPFQDPCAGQFSDLPVQGRPEPGQGIQLFGDEQLDRAGLARNAAIGAIRTPRIPQSIPKALTEVDARMAVEAVGDLSDEPWVARRDTALLLLLYGCGLRIGEALALNRGQAPTAKAGGTMVVTGKGNKQRMVPVLPVVARAIDGYLAACPYPLGNDDPLFVGVRGKRLNPGVV